MMPPSGLSGTSRSDAGSTRRKVARSPKDSSSRGMGACRAGTGLEGSAMTTKRAGAPATIFSPVWAPPPPLTSNPSGAIWSAPSIVMSNRSMLVTSSIRKPSSRAACSVRGDVAAQTMSRDRLAKAGSRYATVEPVPSPTVMPFSTSPAAASAAACFSCSMLMTVCRFLPGDRGYFTDASAQRRRGVTVTADPVPGPAVLESRLVTISAAYGAGGSVVAPALAQRLGVPFLQRVTSNEADPADCGPCAEQLTPEEARSTPVHRLLASFPHAMPVGPTQSPPPPDLIEEDLRGDAESGSRSIAG